MRRFFVAGFGTCDAGYYHNVCVFYEEWIDWVWNGWDYTAYLMGMRLTWDTLSGTATDGTEAAILTMQTRQPTRLGCDVYESVKVTAISPHQEWLDQDEYASEYVDC